MSTKEEISNFLEKEFPQAKLEILELNKGQSVIKKSVGFENLRPGGTVSGPTLFAVADAALYIAVLGEIGLVPLAVTSQLSINFLEKPAADKAIIGKCQLIKIGKTLITGQIELYSEGSDQMIAHSVGTYAIPSK